MAYALITLLVLGILMLVALAKKSGQCSREEEEHDWYKPK